MGTAIRTARSATLAALAAALVAVAMPGCRSAADREPSRARAHVLAAIETTVAADRSAPREPAGLRLHTALGWHSLAWRDLACSWIETGAGGRWLYAGCANGALISRDAGKSWWLTGGTDLRHVQRVCIDRRDPRRAWAATPDGVFRLDDAGAESPRWRRLLAGNALGYCNDVVQDVDDPDRIWIGSESGLFTTADGRSFSRRGPEVAVHRIVHDAGPRRVLIAATDGAGLQLSSDAGRTWRRAPALPDVCYCVTRDPDRDGRLLAGGIGRIYYSRDGGENWLDHSVDLPETFYVYDLALDPSDAARVLAGGSDGVFESADGGRSWQRHSLPGAVVPRLVFATLRDMARDGPSSEPGVLGLEPVAEVVDASTDRVGDRGFYVRGEAVADDCTRGASATAPSTFACALVAAEHGDAAGWQDRVRRLLDAPERTAAFALTALGCYLHCRDALPATLRERFRRTLTRTEFYRGDEEHDWVMFHAALLLAAQTWPATAAAEWFTGRDSRTNYETALDYLRRWARQTVRSGWQEADAPTRLHQRITPLLLLHDFARDAGVRRLAAMLLDLLLADFLTQSLAGSWCGPHDDAEPTTLFDGPDRRTAAYHYLYAGGIDKPSEAHPWLAFAIYSSYRAPPMFAQIANSRARAFVHRERSRTRQPLRDGDGRAVDVHRYLYMTRQYAIGSQRGGAVLPLRQHSWDVTWRSLAQNPVLFAVHPHGTQHALAMLFPGDRRLLTRRPEVTTGYWSADKWTSASPYEHVLQHRNVLLALYDIPAVAAHREVSLYFPAVLDKAEQRGWIFGRDGAFYVALYACQPGRWEPGDTFRRLRCTDVGSAGFVVVAGSAYDEVDDGRLQTYESFQRRVLENAPPQLDPARVGGGGAALSYTSPSGHRLSVDARGGLVLGEATARADMLYDGPFLRSELGSGVIRLSAGDSVRVLDFNRLEVR